MIYTGGPLCTRAPGLRFIPFEQDDLIAQLDAGLFDVGMAGVSVTTPRLEKMTFSEPYFETALCFIVPDYRRNEFSTAESIKRIPKFRTLDVS